MHHSFFQKLRFLRTRHVLTGLGLFLALATSHPSAASMLHSHNDYEQEHALTDALAQRFDSVEADIWFLGGELRVGHLPWGFKGTLRELYLEPLARAVRTGKGSVYGDGRPFYLWIEFKDSDERTVQRLREELGRYSFLSEFSAKSIRPGAVTVILTGNVTNKRRFLDLGPVSKACRDTEDLNESLSSSENQWRWVSVDWEDHFRWQGNGTIPAGEKFQLQKLIDQIHARKRKLRFFNSPDLPNFWQLAHELGIDMIGTDTPRKLRRFFDSLFRKPGDSPLQLFPGIVKVRNKSNLENSKPTIGVTKSE